MLSTSMPSQTQLTGLLMVLSPQSRTKAHVDHAGHSPPLDPWREDIKSRTQILFLFPSNNLLTALSLKETWAAMEVSWIMPSNMLREPLWKLRLNTHTLVELELATHPRLDQSPSPTSPMSLKNLHLPSLPPLLMDQSLLQSMLPHSDSNSTTQVS